MIHKAAFIFEGRLFLLVSQKFKKRCKFSSFRLSVKVKPFRVFGKKSSFFPLLSKKSIFFAKNLDCLRSSTLAKKASFFYFFCLLFVLVKNFNTAVARFSYICKKYHDNEKIINYTCSLSVHLPDGLHR